MEKLTLNLIGDILRGIGGILNGMCEFLNLLDTVVRSPMWHNIELVMYSALVVLVWIMWKR